MQTVHVTIRQFLRSLRAAGRAPKTIRSYDERLRALADFVGDLPLSEVTPIDMDDFVIRLQARGLAGASIRGYIQAVKAFWSWAVARGLLERSPAAFLIKPKVDWSVDGKTIDPADLMNMIKRAEKNGDLLTLAMLIFLADTACRVGELCRLDIEDVDFTNQEATVYGKTGRRIVDFTDLTAGYLEALIGSRTSGPVFIANSGRVTINQVNARFRYLGTLVGARRYNPHSIRHLVGRAWLDSGANLELVRRKLGHSDITTTSRFYAHQDRDRQKAATRRFSLMRGFTPQDKK